MIPKTIHYCWFGKGEKSKLALRCIKSWKKICPDYEQCEWNEDNFDIASSPQYVQQAYQMKKWAFVADYVRLYAMVTCGGVYMDTDVELLKPLDNFLKHEAFAGFELGFRIQTGLLACCKGFPLFEHFLHYYDNVDFINPDQSLNMTPNVKIISDICTVKGFVGNDRLQNIEGFVIYPTEFFSPKSCSDGTVRKTANTHAIHHYSASWLSQEKRKAMQDFFKQVRRNQLIHIPNQVLLAILGSKLYEKLKQVIKK